MKILLLTDLSKNCQSADEMAVDLCLKLHVDLLLMFNYTRLPSTSISGTTPDFIHLSEFQAQRMPKMAECIASIKRAIARSASDYLPKITSIVTEGEIGNMVAQIIPREDIFLVVMGQGRSSTFAHLLFGNSVYAVIKKAICPVLVVPKTLTINKIEKIVFATDLNRSDDNAIDYLARLGLVLHFAVTLVHVCNPLTACGFELDREHEMIKCLSKYPHLTAKYVRLIGEDVAEKIEEACKRKSCTIAISDHPRTFIQDLFGDNTIREILKIPSLTVLVFPASMEPSRYFFKPTQNK